MATGLWLVEVEEVPRSEIAGELGIKPNAVSVLYRRARKGLRLSWLEHQIPTGLRDDSAHAARLLPKALVSRGPAMLPREISAHLDSCETCAAVYADLRTAHRQMSKSTLAVAGFAALGVALPAASSASITAVGGGAMLFGGIGVGTALLAASVSLLIAGGTVTTGLVLWDQNRTTAEQTSTAQHQDSSDPQRGKKGTPADEDRQGATSQPDLGRNNTDDSIQVLEFSDFDPSTVPPRAEAPPRQTPSTSPGPSTETPPGQDPSMNPGLTTPAIATGYFAPVVAGQTSPDSSVIVEVDGAEYVIAPESDGSWSLDLRSLGLPAGTYPYRVWTVRGDEASTATTGEFTITSIEVTGLTWTEDMYLGEASTTGVVVRFSGPKNGTLFIADSPSGVIALLPLDENGTAVRRMRFFGTGTHFLGITPFADGYGGAALLFGLQILPDAGSGDPYGGEGEGFELLEM